MCVCVCGCSLRGFQAAQTKIRFGVVASSFLGRQELLSEKQSGCAGTEVSQGPSGCAAAQHNWTDCAGWHLWS